MLREDEHHPKTFSSTLQAESTRGQSVWLAGRFSLFSLFDK